MRLNKRAIQRKVNGHNTGQLYRVHWPRRCKCGLWGLGHGLRSVTTKISLVPINSFVPKPLKRSAFPALRLKSLISLFLGKTNLGIGVGVGRALLLTSCVLGQIIYSFWGSVSLSTT